MELSTLDAYSVLHGASEDHLTGEAFINRNSPHHLPREDEQQAGPPSPPRPQGISCSRVDRAQSATTAPQNERKQESRAITDSSEAINDEPSIDSLPKYLRTLIAGSAVCGDSYVPFSKPDWFDVDKFRRGQRFAVDHLFGVVYCELISLLMLFAFVPSLEPLIFTGKSDSPFKAFQRYLSTVTRVKSWYEGDVFDETSVAHKNLITVRNMHEAVRKKITGVPKEVITNELKITDRKTFPTLPKQREELLNDFKSCPFLQSTSRCSTPVYISQCDMAVTQFGFAGLLLLFPNKFGIHRATTEDLESFAHFWRTIGFLLGVKDQYNFCDGDLVTVRQRCRDIIQHWVRPSFRELSHDWLHMSRCVFDGLNYFLPCSTFEVILLFLCNVLEINAFKLKASLSIIQLCIYQYSIFLYSCLTHLPGAWTFHNWIIRFAILIYKLVNYCNSRERKI